tara:strand:- start:2074 stop:4263 length:2190 start_codon:yes stop_codon:yes gene_type:complete
MAISRRGFLTQLGYVSIGFSLMGATCGGMEAAQGKNVDVLDLPPTGDRVNAWLRILENGEVQILTGKMELGQGIGTALIQLAAEELNMSMDKVRLHLAETGVTQDEGYTAGSRSIESSGMSIRNAAATARELLLKLVSEKWDVPIGELSLETGRIYGAEKDISLEELLKGQQIDAKIGKPSKLLGKTRRKFVGRPIPRQDIADMVIGKQFFLHDLRFPDMVHARIVRPRTYSAKLLSLGMENLEASPGFLKLVNIGSFVGILTKEEYQAVQLKKNLEKSAKWDYKQELPVDIPLETHIKNVADPPETTIKKGKGILVDQEHLDHHKASYSKPYIMHASNGPSCAIAYFNKGHLKLWSHSQGVYPLRNTLSKLLKMAEEHISIKGVPGAGCYGHNGADDVAAEAALMALEYPGKHIRLQWMREDEHAWEPYGTAMVMELQAALNSQGKIVRWAYDLWSDGHSTRPGGDPSSLLPARYLDRGYGMPTGGYKGGGIRNSEPYYDLENLQIQFRSFKGPLRASALRGLGAYANIFAIESFMDELALKAGKDPIDFRLDHLSDDRARTCLERLRNATKLVVPKEGQGIGHAFSRYKNEASYCAIAALVEVDRSSGKVIVRKMWGVIDSGEAINPEGIRNQTEGGMVQSASWALKEEVKFNADHITSIDWNTYPILRFPETPEVEVEVIDRPDQPPLGAGEAAQGPATAAILNAIYRATGSRIRSLPVTSEKLRL